jgi:hypothetical protein
MTLTTEMKNLYDIINLAESMVIIEEVLDKFHVVTAVFRGR